MGTNSKMKDETYNEEIDKCEEIKIFEIFPGIKKGKVFFIVLLFFLRIKIRIWASVIFTTWIRIKISQNLLEYFFEFMFTIFLWFFESESISLIVGTMHENIFDAVCCHKNLFWLPFCKTLLYTLKIYCCKLVQLQNRF